MATNNSCNYVPTQYNVQTGGASGTLNNVAPSATSGVPVISQGSSAQPIFGTVAIAGGGTNATSMSTSTGIVKYDGTSLVTSSTAKIDSSNRMTNTSQPAFLVNLANNLSNKTGDGTAYTVVFDNTVFDQGSNITLSGTTFTAPVTGRYALQVGLFVSGMTASDTDLRITLVTTGSAGSVFPVRINPSTIITSGFYSGGGSIIVPLSATQTVQVTLTVSGSTKTVGLLGGTDSECFFSGYLVC